MAHHAQREVVRRGYRRAASPLKKVGLAAALFAVTACAAQNASRTAASEPANKLSPQSSAAPMPVFVANAGEQLYNRHCLTCHQADGYGVPRLQPAIVDSAWLKGEPQALALFVLTGGLNSAERKESENHNVMPAFPQLSDEDLALLLTFVRQKFGGGASAVSAIDVAAARGSIPK